MTSDPVAASGGAPGRPPADGGAAPASPSPDPPLSHPAPSGSASRTTRIEKPIGAAWPVVPFRSPTDSAAVDVDGGARGHRLRVEQGRARAGGIERHRRSGSPRRRDRERKRATQSLVGDVDGRQRHTEIRDAPRSVLDREAIVSARPRHEDRAVEERMRGPHDAVRLRCQDVYLRCRGRRGGSHGEGGETGGSGEGEHDRGGEGGHQLPPGCPGATAEGAASPCARMRRLMVMVGTDSHRGGA